MINCDSRWWVSRAFRCSGYRLARRRWRGTGRRIGRGGTRFRGGRCRLGWCGGRRGGSGWWKRAGGAQAVRPEGKALERVAWFAGNSKEQPHRVATKAPNAWGLYDMLGNVGEWVIRSDESAVLAGGSHQDEAADVSSAAREVPDM